MKIICMLFQEFSSSVRPGAENALVVAVQDKAAGLPSCVIWSSCWVLSAAFSHKGSKPAVSSFSKRTELFIYWMLSQQGPPLKRCVGLN